MLEKVNLNQVLAIGIVGLAINNLFVGCGKSSTIDKLQSNTNSTMGTIKAEQSSVGVKIGRSQASTGNALEAISRSQTEIDGSRKAVDGIEAGVREIQSILTECQRLTRKSKAIINGIDGADRS